MEIVIHEGTDEAIVRSFLNAQWHAIDPEPWVGGRCVIRAERDGTLIGVATCSYSAGVAHLSELMVAPEERNHGIGARLLAAFEEWATTHNAHKLSLNTRLGGPAQRLYERNGWRIENVRENHYLHQDYVVMVKEPGKA
ncbi:MAG: GNAT family N-acetyltransferase [Chloroflexota bacterium]|nr:GNAT family N-acetyltransferase [Chloroflexota bacterium]